MEFLGIGGWELAVVFILMLIVAGPKRMIAWSYTLGRYLAVLRNLWAETATALQREFHEAGVDVEIPKNVPTRGSVTKLVMDTVNKAAAPVTDPLKEVEVSAKGLLGPTPRITNKPVTPQYPGAPKPAPRPAAAAAPSTSGAPTAPEGDTYGAWGGGTAPATPALAEPEPVPPDTAAPTP